MEDNNESNVIDVNGVNESAVMSGFGVHSTPKVGQDNKLDESNVIDDSGIQITPISINKNNQSDNSDVMRYLCGMNAMLCVKFDEQNVKFHELKSEIHEQKIKCESRFNEIKSNFDEKFDKINNRFDTNENNFNESKLINVLIKPMRYLKLNLTN